MLEHTTTHRGEVPLSRMAPISLRMDYGSGVKNRVRGYGAQGGLLVAREDYHPVPLIRFETAEIRSRVAACAV